MAKGGLIIDVLAGPPKGDDMEDEDAGENVPSSAPGAGDPDALIAGIQTQLDQLRDMVARLG